MTEKSDMSLSAPSRSERIEAAATALLAGWWNYEIKTYTAEGQRLLNALRDAVQAPTTDGRTCSDCEARR